MAKMSGDMGQPGNEGGISQRKVMAGTNTGGNMGVMNHADMNRHTGDHPDYTAGTGQKGAMDDSMRGAGPGVGGGKGMHGQQAAPDHGPMPTNNQHSYGGKA